MTQTHRRTVLSMAGLVAAGGVGVVAGCTPEAGTGTEPSTGASAAPSSSGSSAAAPSSAASSGGASSAPAPTGPSVPVSQVPEGGGVILPDADFVVTQPSAGEFKAFSKICTHQGCPISAIAEGTINCNCHGSKFSLTDGSVVEGPADTPLAETPTAVSGDQVVVQAG